MVSDKTSKANETFYDIVNGLVTLFVYNRLKEFTTSVNLNYKMRTSLS